MTRLHGVIAAIPTPVTATAEPDTPRLLMLARNLLENGCDGLNVLGTTGEATSFSVEQRARVMSEVAAELPRDRLFVGTGAAAIADAIRLSRHAAEIGFAGALLLPPFYYKDVRGEGVIAYVNAIVETTREWNLPIYLYNFPALSGVAYTESIVAELVERCGARIAGLKDSSGDLAYARRIAAIAARLQVFPSNEAALIEARSRVFAGCISATANLNSRHCAKAYHEGDERALQSAVAIRKMFDGLPLISAVKFVLSLERHDGEFSRVLPPLTPLSPEQREELGRRWS